MLENRLVLTAGIDVRARGQMSAFALLVNPLPYPYPALICRLLLHRFGCDCAWCPTRMTRTTRIFCSRSSFAFGKLFARHCSSSARPESADDGHFLPSLKTSPSGGQSSCFFFFLFPLFLCQLSPTMAEERSGLPVARRASPMTDNWQFSTHLWSWIVSRKACTVHCPRIGYGMPTTTMYVK